MSAKSDPRVDPAGAEYFYRRSLNVREALPVIGVGVAVGLAASYLAYLYLQRTPLVPRASAAMKRRPLPTRAHGG